MSTKPHSPNAYDGSDHARKSFDSHFLAAVGHYLDETLPGTPEAIRALGLVVRVEAVKQKAGKS